MPSIPRSPHALVATAQGPAPRLVGEPGSESAAPTRAPGRRGGGRRTCPDRFWFLLLLWLWLWLAAAPSLSLADALSELPAPWQGELIPIDEADISGAERLMQEAVTEARREVARLLTSAGESGEAAHRDALAEAYGRLGALALLLEMETQADACFHNAHRLQPQELRWPYYAGYLAMMAGNTERALEQLGAAQAIDPDYPPLYLRLGKVQLDRSELAEARAALERIADTPGLVTAANFYLGQIANLERRHRDAVGHLEKALAADPEATEVHYPLAQAYRALGENELAKQHLDRFALKTPQAHDPLLEQLQGAAKRSLPAFQKALHATREGDYAAAAALFAEGLAIDPDNQAARVSHARVLYLAGRGDEAAAELDKVLMEQPDNALAHFLAGVLDQQRGETEQAARHYRHALAHEPGHAGALFYLANLDFAAGRYDSAAAGYAKARAAEREIAPARLLELVARLRAGEPEGEIAERLESARAEHPEDPMLGYASARLLAAAGDPAVRDTERARAIASRLSLLQPIPPHQRLLAFTQAAAGDFEAAVKTHAEAAAMAAWMAGPAARAELDAELRAYENGELPMPAWPASDPLLSPPPFDPVAPFRDYPAAAPY